MPPALARSLAFALTLALAAATGAPAAESQEAAAIAGRAFDRDFGGLEAWRIRAGAAGAAFLLARRTLDGRAQVAIDVVEPAQHRNLRLLLFETADGSVEWFWIPNYASSRTKWKIDTLPAGDWTQHLPHLPGEVALLDVIPLRAAAFAHERRGKETIAGELCDVISSTPAGARGFDRLEQAVSRRTGVALRRSWFRGEREFRRDLVAPADVKQLEERWLATRTRIESPPGRASTELALERVRETSELPERLFERRALPTRRFPTF